MKIVYYYIKQPGALLLGSFLLLFTQLNAQPVFRLGASNGKLVLKNVDNVRLVGYTGKEIVFTAKGSVNEQQEDKRAAGLRQINARGQSDNTGMGLAVRKHSQHVEVGQVARRSEYTYVIQVPATMRIYYSSASHHNQQLVIENISEEVEADCHHHDILMKDVTGPTIVNTIYGKIRAEYEKKTPQHDMTLHSHYGDIEFRVPAYAKADFRLQSSYGDMYTDLDLELEEQPTKLKDSKCEADRIAGKLNGGGVLITIRATYDDIYLRKK